MDMLQCYLMQEKNEDESGVLQGTLDIIDEFVHAFSRNANKNINFQSARMDLLAAAGNHASDDLVAKNFFDLAWNIKARFFEDNDIKYADIMVIQTMRLWNKEGECQETIEILLKCLSIYFEDEENQKERIQQVHRYLSRVYLDNAMSSEQRNKDKTKTKPLGELLLMLGRTIIKLEKDIYGEIRSSGDDGIENFGILYKLGDELMYKFVDPSGPKQEFYDEMTEYFHEALAIAKTIQSQELIFSSARIYLGLSGCELMKAGKGGVRKALEYKEEALLKLDKLDQTFIMENPDKIKSTLDEIEQLSYIIRLTDS